MPLASVPVELAAYKPRLATILGELRTDNRRIDAEHAKGHLSRVEFNKLKAREAQIRSEAMAAASRNGVESERALVLTQLAALLRRQNQLDRAEKKLRAAHAVQARLIADKG